MKNNIFVLTVKNPESLSKKEIDLSNCETKSVPLAVVYHTVATICDIESKSVVLSARLSNGV